MTVSLAVRYHHGVATGNEARAGTLMNKRQYSKTELGMMYGLLAGAAIFAIMFALTGNVLWTAAVGAGLALGLGIGATMDKSAS